MKSFFTLALIASLSFGAFASVNPVTIAELPVQELKDCTVNIDVTNDDGSTTTGTIVISDISWWDCAKIHIADFFSNEF